MTTLQIHMLLTLLHSVTRDYFDFDLLNIMTDSKKNIPDAS